MDGFSYLVYIPSLKCKKRFLQLDNITYKTIVKFIQNNDDEYLVLYLMKIIKDLCVDHIDTSKLLALDILSILLAIRVVCIGASLDLTIKGSDNKDVNLTVDLNELLNRVANFKYKKTRMKIDDITLTVTIPRQLIIRSDLDCIYSITVNNKTYNMHEFSDDDRDKMFNCLPATIFKQLSSKLRNATNNKKIIVLEGSDRMRDLVINLLSNDVFMYIKMLLNDSLDNIYTLYYVLASKLHFDLNYIDGIMPIESQIFINRYNDEIEQSNKSIEDSKQKENVGGMIPGPSAHEHEDEHAIPGGFKF